MSRQSSAATVSGLAILSLSLSSGLVCAQVAPSAPPTAAASSISDAILDGKPILELRARYEGVDQTKTAKVRDDAQAYTVRSHVGWQTRTWDHLQVLVEAANVSSIGPERYAVNVPGATTPPLNGAAKAMYPLINDPITTEFNRAQITWTPLAGISSTLGRQRINIDDQRFVGSVNWRQDEQTFDGVRGDVKLGNASLFIAYLDRINRTLADYRDFRSDSYLVNLRYEFQKDYGLEGFDYRLNFGNSPLNSSQTWGAKGSGKTPIGPVKLAYNATFARQSDYAAEPTPYGLDFYAADIAATYSLATVRFDYEQLNGNGVRGFTTPLATTHNFQGWADAFVSPGGNKSFVDGIKDYNVSLSVKPPIKPMTFFSKPEIFVRFHDFEDELRGSDIGHEWDLSATAALTERVAVLLKYADFKRDTSVPLGAATPPASRTKVWLSLEFKL